MRFSKLREHLIDDLDAGVSAILTSMPGVGKSEFIEYDLIPYLSKRDGFQWGFATAFLATYTPPDLLGYQFKGDRDFGDGKITTVTEPTLPLWMVTSEGKPTWMYKRGILLLDEYGQAEPDVKRASAELLRAKQIGPWKLGGEHQAGWGVIAAQNRATDQSGVTKDFLFTTNRRREYHISPHIDDWLEWAEKNGILPITKAFAKQNPGIVFPDKVPDKMGPHCTARSLVMHDKAMRVKMARLGHLPEDSETIEGAHGLIGDATAQYFAFVKLERAMPDFADIVKSPETVKVPEKPDAQMLVMYNLAHRVDNNTVKPVIKYVERLGGEFAAMFARSAVKRDATLVINPAIREWCTKNASVMAALAA